MNKEINIDIPLGYTLSKKSNSKQIVLELDDTESRKIEILHELCNNLIIRIEPDKSGYVYLDNPIYGTLFMIDPICNHLEVSYKYVFRIFVNNFSMSFDEICTFIKNNITFVLKAEHLTVITNLGLTDLYWREIKK